ncbi:MAG: nifR3 family TIM-barrel protein [Puniceicoccaceae bacterium 5H]|nr:MAG: nifR3 family TIM-barrel protein [Puniceicoccaceae bacterium 5H]
MESPVSARLPWFGPGKCPLYLAPMAGFTDPVFRQICKEYGADVMVTEFVMANKFLDPRGEVVAWETVDFSPEQRPMGVQIFGSNPEKMGQAARKIVDRLEPDFIDINYGCPAPRVVDQCAGSSLLTDLPRLQAVAQAVVERVTMDVPVTAKIRTGWDDDSIVAVEASRRLVDVGIEAIAVHGRTKVQGYRGAANWEVIQAVAEGVPVPVVGNGSVDSAQEVMRLREQTSVAGLMIGRAALGYPWIFREIKETLRTGVTPPPADIEERWQVLLRYCREMLDRPRRGEAWDHLGWMRPRLKAFTKVIPGSRQLRQQLEKVNHYDDLVQIAEEHLANYGQEDLSTVLSESH